MHVVQLRENTAPCVHLLTGAAAKGELGGLVSVA